MIVYCEHCGELETETPQFKDENGVEWCAWCAHANDLITEQQLRLVTGDL